MQKSVSFGQIFLSNKVQSDKKDRLENVIIMMVSVMKLLLLLLKHVLSIIKGHYELIRANQKRVFLTVYDILYWLALQRYSFSLISINLTKYKKKIDKKKGQLEVKEDKKQQRISEVPDSRAE